MILPRMTNVHQDVGYIPLFRLTSKDVQPTVSGGYFIMQRSTFRFLLLPTLLAVIASIMLSSCGGSSSSSSSSNHVTLVFSGWQPDTANTYKTINDLFTKEHPNITVRYQATQSDSYQTVLQTKFPTGSVGDIVAFDTSTFPKDPFVQNGYLANLADQPWVSRLTRSARAVTGTASNPSSVYAMPLYQAAGGLVYNKAIFAKLGLSVPTTWADFLHACQVIKAAGILPLAVGAKDGWPLQMVEDMMIINAVYHDHPTFHQDVLTGKTTYGSSTGWQQTLKDIQSLKQQGYLSPNVVGTSWSDAVNLIAASKAAMMVTYDFALGSIATVNPNTQLGFVAMPYVTAGQQPTVSVATSILLAVSTKSKHIAEAKEYLQFLSRPDISGKFLGLQGALPTFTNVTPAKISPAESEILPAYQANSLNNAAIGIAGDQFTALNKSSQELLAGTATPSQVLQALDSTK